MAQGIKVNISYEELKNLLEKYTIKEIAEKLKVSTSTINRYKNKYNLQSNILNAKLQNSIKHTKYTCDGHYFDKIDTFNKSYLLGFLCADGFVTDRNEVGIGVAVKDKEILDFFKKEIKSNKTFYFNQNTNSVELRIQNIILANSLKDKGIVPRKSLILDIEKVINKAKLTKEQIPIFLLGYLDGDGCISLAHRKKNNTEYFEMNITGTLETILYYKNFFDGHGTITKRYNNDNNNYTLQFSNNFLTIYNALNKMYKYIDKIDFFLQRKYNLFIYLKSKIKVKS